MRSLSDSLPNYVAFPVNPAQQVPSESHLWQICNLQPHVKRRSFTLFNVLPQNLLSSLQILRLHTSDCTL